jgi:hypothetical protein
LPKYHLPCRENMPYRENSDQKRHPHCNPPTLAWRGDDARMADHRGRWARAWPSAREQAVAAVVVMAEVRRVAAWVPLPMFGEEDAVRVIGPAGTGAPYIVWPETFAETTVGAGTADVFNEAAHSVIFSPTRCGRQAPTSAYVRQAERLILVSDDDLEL